LRAGDSREGVPLRERGRSGSALALRGRGEAHRGAW
jgi:hypothetical protein